MFSIHVFVVLFANLDHIYDVADAGARPIDAGDTSLVPHVAPVLIAVAHEAWSRRTPAEACSRFTFERKKLTKPSWK